MSVMIAEVLSCFPVNPVNLSWGFHSYSDCGLLTPKKHFQVCYEKDKKKYV